MIDEANIVLALNLTEDDLWHKRLSHISQKGLEALSKQDILPLDICSKLSFCEHCVLGKARKQSFTKAQHTTKGILDYIYPDLWGPTPTPSLRAQGISYHLLMIFQEKIGFILKKKDQVFEKF